MRRFRLGLALAAIAAALVLALAACGGDDDDGGEGGGEGGTVTVLSLWGGSEKEAFDKVLAKFTADTGIQTQYETARDFLPVIRSRLAAGNPPSMAIVPRPGIVADLARDGSLMTLDDLGLDADEINENYSEAWTNLTTVDDEVYGIVAKANSKSTVWYDPSRVTDEPPTNWEGLLALTDKLKGEGKTPWAVGAGDGWPLTDWFESIYLYQNGAEKYDQLFTGEVPFDDQTVKDALTEMYKVLTEENLPGGVEGALATPFVDSIGQVFGKTPKAELYYEGGFVGGIATGQVNTALKPGETIDFFQFPEINPDIGTPLLGAGDVAVAFNDDENTGKLMEFLARGRGDGVGLDGRDRVAQQGGPARRVPERPGAQGGRAGAERGGLRVRRLRPPPRRARHRVAERPAGDHEEPGQHGLGAGGLPVNRVHGVRVAVTR
jgi:alpha-glucoside transport system substrate-binding protein